MITIFTNSASRLLVLSLNKYGYISFIYKHVDVNVNSNFTSYYRST